MPQPPVFVLDHDFPTSMIPPTPFPDFSMVPLREMHPDLVQDHEDWEVMRELKVRGGVDGWITLDSSMLSLEKEMVVLHQSRLSLIVFKEVDNDPLVAAGLLFIHMPTIARQHDASHGQLWVLRKPSTKSPERPWNRIVELAARSGRTAKELEQEHRLPAHLFMR